MTRFQKRNHPCFYNNKNKKRGGKRDTLSRTYIFIRCASGAYCYHIMLVSYTGTPAGRGGGCFLLSSACACSTDFSLYDNQKDRVPKSSRLTIFHKQGVYIIRRVGRKYMILRGNLVNRTYGKNKNLYISVFFTTIIGPVYYGPPYWQQLIRVILIREFVSHSFHIFFAQLFHLPDFPGLFFRKK